MPSLSDILLSVKQPEGLVNDLARTLEAHIGSRSGLKGMAMKTGFSVLRSAKPDISQRAVRGLLPDITKALEPVYGEFRKSKAVDFGSYLGDHAERAVGLVIAAVDARLAASGNPTAQKIYRQFRGNAGDELRALLPMVGRVLSAHMT